MKHSVLAAAFVGVVAMVSLVWAPDLTRGEPRQPAEQGNYHSPYSIKLTFPRKELLGDIEEGAGGNPREQSTIPFPDWSSRDVLKRYGAWGPPARHYPAPEGVEKKSAAWKRERVIAVALRFQGYAYQHHHIPDWNPPADWPWKETSHGRNSKGVDCSNFTSFAYNQALGIKPNSAIRKQAELVEVAGPGGQRLRVERIKVPATYAEFSKVLRTGDLLFVRNTSDEISHVVLWVGGIGAAPDSLPLILDSTSAGARDCNGLTIPDGVQLRPFREKSWYCQKASHALWLIPDE